MWGRWGRKTKRQCIDDRHVRAMYIGDDAVRATDNPSEWKVRSSAGDEFYTVRKLSDACPQVSCRETNRYNGSDDALKISGMLWTDTTRMLCLGLSTRWLMI
ncbi:uncharacterized protein LOC113207122 [Frankliniella occidentalis]|uniref:Uncharacterized protein LOC113207122 n=1 Tax=Frankliniella occidentalis TaxID=133901 RepID=A0A9C6WQ25_FRAOC|nr:uncharacterized protein LOC113207122 [Frankliniella occidentalis]